jgi:hypothetical protein
MCVEHMASVLNLQARFCAFAHLPRGSCCLESGCYDLKCSAHHTSMDKKHADEMAGWLLYCATQVIIMVACSYTSMSLHEVAGWD